jgi:hypothetical protein
MLHVRLPINMYYYMPFYANGFYEQPPGFGQDVFVPADLMKVVTKVKVAAAESELIILRCKY